LIFTAGLLVGAALCALSFSLALARTPQEAPDVIAKVAGWDGAAASTPRTQPTSSPTSAPASPHRERLGSAPALGSGASGPAKAMASAPERRSASQIAEGALGFTVYVRGGRVYGAGLLLDDKGHVLTCEHVIAGVEQLVVSFSDGSTHDAVLVESDPKLDLALLRIDADRVPGLEPAAVSSVQLGDDVFSVGAPRKMAFSLGRGMVSFIGRAFDGVYYLQTDLAMNGGSSGGPVLNDRGQVIALSSFVLRDSEGLAFALPIEYAYRRFAAHLQMPKTLGGSARSVFEGWLSALDGAQQVGTARARD
jgi:S1-C subfamily serine protease